MTLDEALAQCPVVAILRGVRPNEVVEHVDALFAAGLRSVEVPLNSPDPLASIARLVETFGRRMVVGAGTVLDVENAEAAADAGAKIIVSPNTAPEVIRRALELGLDPAPGFATASEAFTALASGARHLKLFPAATYGVGHLKQLRAVLPASARVWTVGGIGPDNIQEWWNAGARAFGLGGELYRAGQSVTETAAKAAHVVAATIGLSP